jgi:two-component system response regulator NreC
MSHSIRVMLADDHEILRQGLRKLLESTEGIEVIGEARTGQSAIEMAEALEPDLVIMDIDLPDMSGIEATRAISRHGAGPRIVGLSCHTDPRIQERMIDAGAKAYVWKKTAFKELAATVREVMNKPAQAEESTASAGRAQGKMPENLASRPGWTPPATAALTARELAVLHNMAEGQSTKEIARTLVVSVKTVETHRRNLMLKLNIDSVAELTKYALREGVAGLNS